MPSPFDITTASNTVNLDNKREGVAVFTVKNNTRRRIHAAAKLVINPPDSVKWLTILPPETDGTDTAALRSFPIDSTQQFQVKIAAPPNAPPGSYTLRLVVADEANPDDNFSQSPDVLFTVREIPKPEPRPFPAWIIPAVIIALLVIALIVVGGVALGNRQQPTPTPTPAPTLTPAPTSTPAPCLVTVTADQLVYTRPEAIPDYIFDQVHAGALLVPVGRLVDNSWWKTNYNDSWIQTSVFGQTATVSGECTNLPILFPP